MFSKTVLITGKEKSRQGNKGYSWATAQLL